MVLERIQKEAKENPLNQGILALAFLLDSDRFCYSAYQQGTVVRGVDDAPVFGRRADDTRPFASSFYRYLLLSVVNRRNALSSEDVHIGSRPAPPGIPPRHRRIHASLPAPLVSDYHLQREVELALLVLLTSRIRRISDERVHYPDAGNPRRAKPHGSGPQCLHEHSRESRERSA